MSCKQIQSCGINQLKSVFAECFGCFDDAQKLEVNLLTEVVPLPHDLCSTVLQLCPIQIWKKSSLHQSWMLQREMLCKETLQ
jgi:hypothetical protein